MTTPELSYLSIAMGAVLARLEGEFPGIIRSARRDLKREADLSIVYGLHGEHETDAERRNHAMAIAWLGRLGGVAEQRLEFSDRKVGRRARA